MTTRRNLFKIAGLAAALPGAAFAADETKASAPAEAPKTGAKTFKGGVTLCEPLPAAPELPLSKTLSPGKSTFNEGVVMNASHWGVYRVHVKGGKIERLEPVKEDKAPSMQLQAIAQQPYNPARIRWPMVRKSYLEKGYKAGGSGRGREPFVRVSWDEALTLVAKEIERVEKTYGPASVFGGSYGWMSTSSIGNARNLLRRALNCAGGFTSHLGDYSTGCAQVILPYVIGADGVYEQVTAWDLICEKTELIVLWGADPSVNNDIDWSTTFHENAEAFRRVRDKGIPCVAVNPLKPDTAEFLGDKCEWIAPKPNTDVAVMLAMCHELETSGAADLEFLRKYTVGADKFLAYVLGKEDGVAKTPAWAEKISGVPAETIKRLAHAMRDKRSMLMGGWGIQRAQFGEQAHWAMVALAAMCGHIGQPGGGFGFTYHYSNGGAATSEAPVLPGISSTPKGITPAKTQPIPLARFSDCFLNPGKVIEYNGTKIKYPDIRLVMLVGRQSVRPAGRHEPHRARPGAGPRRRSSRTSSGRPRRAWPTSCSRRAPRSSATTSRPSAPTRTSATSPCSRQSSRSGNPAPTTGFTLTSPRSSARRKPSPKAWTRWAGSAASTSPPPRKRPPPRWRCPRSTSSGSAAWCSSP
jgi:trimethylamine-N-oxide reductase (cytochrome c)